MRLWRSQKSPGMWNRSQAQSLYGFAKGLQMKHLLRFQMRPIWLRVQRRMLNGLRLRKRGKLLLASLALLLPSGCRDSIPPKIEICILDGTGGGDCVEADGSQVHKTPDELLNYWATNQVDESNFSSWCYDTSSSVVNAGMDRILKKARE